tara:strand:+ start:51 stop:260 length:210 start_codon:yes stop_codon:yes gene_type:complete
MGIYEYTTSNPKLNSNELTVEFLFPVSTTKDEAVEQIDKLVSLADNSETFTFELHEPKFYEKSMYAEEE